MPIDTRALKGKRIMLSGGTTGIGRAALAFMAAEGACVVTYGRHQPELDESLEAARRAGQAAGGEVFGLTADSTRPEDLDAVFDAVDAHLGGIDIMVANAALGAEPVHEMKEADWRYVVDTNFVGYLACAHRAIARMERQGTGGHLLFVGSIAVEIQKPGESVYAATKAGIQAFAETLRKEVQDKGIKVTVIQPGAAGSDMQPGGDQTRREAIANNEMLYAEEVAEAIIFALTRSERTDVVSLRIEPLIQKTS